MAGRLEIRLDNKAAGDQTAPTQEMTKDNVDDVSFDVLPPEMIAMILVCLPHAKDLGRCRLVSRRFCDLVSDDVVWWDSIVHKAHTLDVLRGQLLMAASAVKGVLWTRRMLDALPDGADGVGMRRDRNVLHMGGFQGDRKRGYVVSACPQVWWQHAQWVDDVLEGRHCVFGLDYWYTCTWRNGALHGRSYTYTRPTHDRRGGKSDWDTWRNGKKHGQSFWTERCLCAVHTKPYEPWRDPWAASFLESYGDHAAVPNAPFGFTEHLQFVDGIAQSVAGIRYCNGDVLANDGPDKATVYSIAANCPDPRFRSVEIQPRHWLWPQVRPGRNLFCPCPHSSPDEFRTYRDYFESGFLPVDEGDRDAIAALFVEAARQVA